MPEVELREQGEHHPFGEVKCHLLIYAYDHPEGLSDLDFRGFLLKKWGITERRTRRDHLKYLEDEGYLVKDNSGDTDYPERWKPSTDIKKFKKLWFDRQNRIWSHATLDDYLRFLSATHVSTLIAKEMIPAFLDSPVSKTFKGGAIYHDLPSRSRSMAERDDLETISRWACAACPLLVSHLFKPDKHVLLCIAMILHKYLDLPAGSLAVSPESRRTGVELPQDFRQVLAVVRDTWSEIRFSPDVSKELICLITLVICLFIHLERNPDAADRIYSAPEYGRLWERFSQSLNDLPPVDTRTSFDAVKVIFTLTFAEELFRQGRPARGGRDRGIVG